MGSAKPESPAGTGSAGAAVSLCGERTIGTKPDKYRAEDSATAELHTGKLNDSRELAAEEKTPAESELCRARKSVRELALRIELQRSMKPESRDGGADAHGYSEVMMELRNAKEELSRLRADVNSALEAKTEAEKAMEASGARAKSYESSVEALRKEVEEADADQVFVELARIEAERELREIEARRRVEAIRFSKNMEMAEEKMRHLRRETERAKQLETKLDATNSDVTVLQSEMELVRAMERSSGKINRPVIDADKREEDEFESGSSLRSAEAELGAAKKELGCVKEIGFQYMASMDLVREELMRIAKETEQLTKLERKSDSTVENLNSKLLKAKSKLESASLADERAEAIVSNLTAALRRLKAEIEAAEEEKESIFEEIETSEIETGRSESCIKSSEEGLLAAMQELEAVKASEATAIEKLRHFSVGVVKTRAASAPLCRSSITISESEYDYLRRAAAAAQVVASKKSSAARAWVEALTAGEREMVMKSELISREIQDLRVEQELYETESLLVARRTIDEPETSNSQLARGTPRKSSGARYNLRSPTITIKKRGKVVPSLVKLSRNQKIGKQELVGYS